MKSIIVQKRRAMIRHVMKNLNPIRSACHSHSTHSTTNSWLLPQPCNTDYTVPNRQLVGRTNDPTDLCQRDNDIKDKQAAHYGRLNWSKKNSNRKSVKQQKDPREFNQTGWTISLTLIECYEWHCWYSCQWNLQQATLWRRLQNILCTCLQSFQLNEKHH